MPLFKRHPEGRHWVTTRSPELLFQRDARVSVGRPEAED